MCCWCVGCFKFLFSFEIAKKYPFISFKHLKCSAFHPLPSMGWALMEEIFVQRLKGNHRSWHGMEWNLTTQHTNMRTSNKNNGLYCLSSFNLIFIEFQIRQKKRKNVNSTSINGQYSQKMNAFLVKTFCGHVILLWHRLK